MENITFIKTQNKETFLHNRDVARLVKFLFQLFHFFSVGVHIAEMTQRACQNCSPTRIHCEMLQIFIERNNKDVKCRLHFCFHFANMVLQLSVYSVTFKLSGLRKISFILDLNMRHSLSSCFLHIQTASSSYG